jgi:L-amino acid N-acyltransferase YncA
MKIRPATPSDIPQLASIHVKGWQTTYKNILPDTDLSNLSIKAFSVKWQKWLQNPDPGLFHLVAEIDAKDIAGFAFAGPERTPVPRFWGELSAIYIQSPHQKQGIGTALFNSVVTTFKKEGYKGMISWMLAENPAGAFYKKLGGTRQGAKIEKFGGVMKELVAFEWTFE